jgi:tRNA nucleotidyltransferase (CCA-adding enzyme)
MRRFKVGGAVRDRLLGRPVTDVDWVVVGARAAELERLGYQRVGRDFPVFLHPHTREEHALARTERKTGRGYRGFTVETSPSVTLEEDLARRDVTINAMAEDESGQIVDPFGGRRDLEAKILRHVSPAFVEDPLRVLRVARFAARLAFTVAPETLALMREIADSGELDALAPERIWSEIERALGEPHPWLFFEVLRGCGALAVLLPELERLFGVPQRSDYHPEIDTGVHTRMVLEQAVALGGDPRVRFAALMHDLGKGETPPAQWPSHKGHEARSAALIDGLCDRFRAPAEYRELALLVARYHGQCHRVDELRAGTVLDLLLAADAFRRPERFERFLLACEADARGRLGLETRPYPQAAALRRAREAAVAIDARGWAQDGLSGEQIAARLREARIAAIDAAARDPDQSRAR